MPSTQHINALMELRHQTFIYSLFEWEQGVPREKTPAGTEYQSPEVDERKSASKLPLVLIFHAMRTKWKCSPGHRNRKEIHIKYMTSNPENSDRIQGTQLTLTCAIKACSRGQETSEELTLPYDGKFVLSSRFCQRRRWEMHMEENEIVGNFAKMKTWERQRHLYLPSAYKRAGNVPVNRLVERSRQREGTELERQQLPDGRQWG